jgi:TM2 domain-containing membrane protein YozV
MKAKVLDYNIQEGKGLLLTEEGERYTFSNSEWKTQEVHPSRNVKVDFVAEENGIATGLYVDEIDSLSNNKKDTIGSNEKSKMVAGLLAIFLGGLGIHKFYMGCQKAGLTMLIIWFFGLFMAGLPSFVIIVISFIEGIVYLTKSDVEFKNTYVENEKCWF